MPIPLLTLADVAHLLHLSPKTVYKHKRRLGGFYPAGIGALRFSPEVIHGVLAGQRQGLAVQVREGGQDPHGSMVCLQGGGEGGTGRASQAPYTGAEKQRLAAELGLRLP